MAVCRVESVCGHATELLELKPYSMPRLHIVFVPGNPGIVGFYKDYLAALSKHFEGAASITAIGHIAHTAHDYEKGKKFSLQQQIDHKAGFLEERYINSDLPTVLVGHSIGAYIILELLKRFPNKLQCVIGLHPFLKTNPDSLKQAVLKAICESSLMRATVSSLAGLLGHSPAWISRRLVKAVVGRAWGPCAVDTTCKYLLRSSMVANFTYMGMTEFAKLKEEVDWDFLRENHRRVCFLFGIDDHWGPLSLLEQVHERVPGLKTAVVQSEDITHDFCCTKPGSEWVARFTAERIKEVFGDDSIQK
ncbi:lipid droplet-associated hydrolase isoform X1 [Selaginella moellendorffii]|uniref:lipid droplet-associated hydrolase isoform X1 n=1 Tax=Selaginella moellendorffii TaxID=88036 RepID=UPI000D1C43C2|nr:lipid droplet-associated hydrolase isoform X1 [Selaginella moellendorffii]|eukprot:XP_024539584.1 lipid droplet-associated hydrolase isoform X1 [Selaginella moellendorffii]